MLGVVVKETVWRLAATLLVGNPWFPQLTSLSVSCNAPPPMLAAPCQAHGLEHWATPSSRIDARWRRASALALLSTERLRPPALEVQRPCATMARRRGGGRDHYGLRQLWSTSCISWPSISPTRSENKPSFMSDESTPDLPSAVLPQRLLTMRGEFLFERIVTAAALAMLSLPVSCAHPGQHYDGFI